MMLPKGWLFRLLRAAWESPLFVHAHWRGLALKLPLRHPFLVVLGVGFSTPSLNDDDALDLLKKISPSARASLMQTAVSSKTIHVRALQEICKAQSVAGIHHRPGLDRFLGPCVIRQKSKQPKKFRKGYCNDGQSDFGSGACVRVCLR